MTRPRPSVTRGDLTLRIVRGLAVLAQRWVGAGELGAAIGVHRRTAYRLLVSLAQAGLPLRRREQDDVRHVRYHLPMRWWEARMTGEVDRNVRLGGRGLKRQAGAGERQARVARGGELRRPPKGDTAQRTAR
jgi:hypothetical protein